MNNIGKVKTRKQLLCSMNNEMTTFWKYLVNFKWYNSDNSRYYKAKYVKTIYGEDYWEYLEEEGKKGSKKALNDYVEESISADIDDFISIMRNDYDNEQGREKVFGYCNSTIESYNDFIKAR